MIKYSASIWGRKFWCWHFTCVTFKVNANCLQKKTTLWARHSCVSWERDCRRRKNWGKFKRNNWKKLRKKSWKIRRPSDPVSPVSAGWEGDCGNQHGCRSMWQQNPVTQQWHVRKWQGCANNVTCVTLNYVTYVTYVLSWRKLLADCVPTKSSDTVMTWKWRRSDKITWHGSNAMSCVTWKEIVCCWCVTS